MTISHERHKASVKKFRKSQFAEKLSCFVKKCVSLVSIVRHVLGKPTPFCVRHHEQFKKVYRYWRHEPNLLERLRGMK